MGVDGTISDRKIPHLLPPAALVVLGSVLATLLLLLLPSRDAIEERITAQKPDQLSLTYLELALSESPDDAELRLLLARQYHEMSRYRAAARVLSRLLSRDSQAGREARLLLVEVEHARCTSASIAARDRCPGAVVDAMDRVLARDRPLDAAVLERFAEISLANRQPALAGKVYSRLADRAASPAERAARREAAASAYVQASQPARAAAMHAQDAREQPPGGASGSVDSAVTNLRKADRASDALALVLEELERAPRSRRLLDAAIALARENERPELAAELGRRRLALNPDNAELVAGQLALELAIGALEPGLALARRLVELRPEDARAREQLARVAGWSGHPLVALDQWSWLALRPDSDEEHHLERAMRLARATWDQERLLALTRRRLREHPEDVEGRVELADLYVRLGRPGEARAVLEQLVAERPGRRAGWDALIEVHGAVADHAAAAETWASVHRRFGTTEAEARAWAEALWRDERPAEALAVVEPRAALSPDRRGPGCEPETLRMVAELAWQLERVELARAAYLALWRGGRAEAHEVDRLIAAARATGDATLALNVARAQWRRAREPSRLLTAMHIAAEAERWDDVAALEAEAEASSGALDPLASYWRLRVARRQRLLRMALASRDFARSRRILDDLSSELDRAARSSRQLARHPDLRALWEDVRRQQIHVALQRRDYEELARVLDAAPELGDTLEYWRLRLLLRHHRLDRAVREGRFDRAEAILRGMDAVLEQAADRGLSRLPEYEDIRDDMNRQRFYVALERGDRATAARLLEVVDIPEIDRVRALERLGRDGEAASLALATRRESPAGGAHSAELDAHVESLTGRMARHVGGHVRLEAMGELTVEELGHEVEYTWQRAGVGAQLVGRQLNPPGAPGLHEAEIRLHGLWRAPGRRTEIGAGAHLRAAGSGAQPQVDLAHRQELGAGLEMRADGAVGRVAQERSSLRPWAVRDHAALALSWHGDRVFASGRLAGYLYRHRDGERLGAGKDAHLSLGYRLMTGPRDWNLRLVGGAATRSGALEPGCDRGGMPCGLLPSEHSRLVAVATTYTRGWMEDTVTPVDRLRYSVELMGGWLAPGDRLVYSASFRVGVPLLGGDQLSVAAELATAFEPGHGGPWSQSRRSVMLAYACSLWL